MLINWLGLKGLIILAMVNLPRGFRLEEYIEEREGRIQDLQSK